MNCFGHTSYAVIQRYLSLNPEWPGQSAEEIKPGEFTENSAQRKLAIKLSSIAWLLAILLVLLPTTLSLYHVIPSWSWIIGVVLYVAMAKWLDRWADKRRAALSEQK